MNTIAKFEKVSREEFRKAIRNLKINATDDCIDDIYNNIHLPKRATKGSAGYDFYSSFGFDIKQGDSIIIPTGVRCRMQEGWVLTLYPRSGMGFKTGTRLANTVGVIDSDYYFSDNEGHIMLKLVNDGVLGRDVCINVGDGICQGILFPFGITEDDNAIAIRNGGFGSTDKQKS